MFANLKKIVQTNLAAMSKFPLFYVEIDRDEIWNRYLTGFDAEFAPEYNCNACKSFLRQVAGLVAIDENYNVLTIWDNVPEDAHEYGKAIKNVRDYVLSLPISDIFYTPVATIGTDRNFSEKHSVVWQHLFLTFPREVIKSNADSLKSIARANAGTLRRALTELSLDATETVLELIAQNSLYRGNEFRGLLQQFSDLQRKFKGIKPNLQNNFAWVHSLKSGAVAGIRNTSIGQLLINISEGMALDQAVGKFEAIVAPSNYKRPTALVTPRMIADAKQTLAELELLTSIDRRFANERDLNTENILFTDHPTELPDIFAQLSKDTVVNPKTLAKIEEIGIDKFIKEVLPTATTLEILLENRHKNNFVTLLTAEHPSAKTLFKWPNAFSWSYTGGVADSQIKDRVREFGGKVDGVLRFSIQWNDKGNNNYDFDAHATEPNGSHISFSSYKKPNITPMSGQLDVDIIRPGGKIAVENITWSDQRKMKEGKYGFFVHNFAPSSSREGFSAEIEFDGQIYSFNYAKPLRNGERVYVANVIYSTDKGFELEPLLHSNSSVSSISKWGLTTNRFHKVTKVMLSPNHWQTSIGNKHFMFFLEDCICDEAPRASFNEFLKEEFAKHRKVFEILGGKIKIPETDLQLSGLGFSDTIHESFIVRVTGRFKRTLKVII